MTEDSRHDHGLHASATELGGDGMTDVVQTGVGMHPRLAGEALEGAGERVGVDEEAVPTFAHEGNRTAQFVEGIAPPRAELSAPLHLLPAVYLDSLQGEGGKLHDPA